MSSDQPLLPFAEDALRWPIEEQSAEHPAARASLGDWLAAGRLACGLSVTDLATELRIRSDYLECLEADAFSRLPARPYVSGYVRSYAIRVGLDPREANRRLQQVWPVQDAALPKVQALRFDAPPKERRVLRSGVAAAALLVAVGTYALWYMGETRGRGQEALSPVAELEETPAAAIGQRQRTSAMQRPSEPATLVVLGPLAPVGVQHLPEDYVESFVRGRQAAENAASSAKEPFPEGPFPRPRPDTPAAVVFASLYGEPPLPADDGPVAGSRRAEAAIAAVSDDALPPGAGLGAYLPKLQLRADLGPLDSQPPAVITAYQTPRPSPAAPETESAPPGRTQAFAAVPRNADYPDHQAENGKDWPVMVLKAVGGPSWIEVRAPDGAVVTSRLLKAGDEFMVPDRRDLMLTTGNAGTLRIVIDGKMLPPLGKPQAVRRGIALNAEALQQDR